MLCLMQSIDLNLLPVVVTLLEEENVTRAAARLNLSVPATSRALDRARRIFGDPLLVRSGRGVTMTPRARALLPELGDALSTLANVIDRPSALLPDRIRRTFVIRANETVISTVGADLMVLVATEAPHAEVRFELEGADDMAALRRGDVDLAIGSYSDVTSDILAYALLEESLVAVVRAGHPHIRSGSRPTITQFAALDHVVVSRKGRRRKAVETLLGTDVKRNVLAVVPSFAVALAIVARSDVTTIAPMRLASLFVDHGGLVPFRSPVRLPTITVSQLWHASNTNDPPHQWLRSCVERAAAIVV